ncbi:uncharacterized protein LOC134180353 [Corticium candelabrum]|uniref:uncharacterized protein LOC134180353 n=1 Tax=Corticium candelabrum TaxID=121492 RepID=UPI002E257EAE|nr:uncharacterized protein LOC134180353 [Corticium candelabrum]
MVLTCHQTALAGEILYIAVLGLYGISTMFVYFTNFEFGMLSMPNWPGFCGGIHGMSLSIGALLLPQIIILLRETFSDFHINPGTIFFCLAILKIISSAPWLPVVSPDCQHKALINEGTHTVRNQDIRKMHVLRSCTMWLMAIGSFAAYVPPLALLAVQEPLLHALWSENHAPISLLSALLMMSFLIGRVLCLFYSDNMGMKRVWITALLAQIVFLGCLGFIMTQRNDSSMKYVGMAVLSAYYVIFPAFKSTMAGFGHEMFGSQYRLLAVSVMSVMSGVAGLVGPVAIDTIYNHFNSYSWFFFGSAGLSLIGGVAILAVQPQHES